MADLFDEMFKSAVNPFLPQLTPEEMMARGVFGGSYFNKATDDDFSGMAMSIRTAAETQIGKFSKARNQYGAKSGDSFEAWAAQGWLKPEDPLGWFHWYCRYASGRRHMRDSWQIQRWVNFADRWGRYGRNQVKARGWCSPVVKQGLLQWAYDPEKVLAL